MGQNEGGSGTAVIDNSQVDLSGTGTVLNVGFEGTGDVTIRNGSVVTANMTGNYLGVQVGNGETGNGTLTVTGAGTKLYAGNGDPGVVGSTRVGRYGTGTLNIYDGAQMYGLNLDVGRGSDVGGVQDGTGTVNIDGAGSRIFLSSQFGTNSSPAYAGEGPFVRFGREAGGVGNLNITNGGVFQLENVDGLTDWSTVRFAREDGAQGFGYISGANSELRITQFGFNGDDYGAYSPLVVGERGYGSLTVTNDAAVNVLGDRATVRIAGGFEGDLIDDGQSKLYVTNGGTVTIDARGGTDLGGDPIGYNGRFYVGGGPIANGYTLVNGYGSRIDLFTEIPTTNNNPDPVLDNGSRLYTFPNIPPFAGAKAVIGDYGDGTLRIENGGVVTLNTYGAGIPKFGIADEVNSTGYVIVTGYDGSLANASRLEVISHNPVAGANPNITLGSDHNGEDAVAGELVISNNASALVQGQNASLFISPLFHDDDPLISGTTALSSVRVESGGTLNIYAEAGGGSGLTGGYIDISAHHELGNAELVIDGATSQVKTSGSNDRTSVGTIGTGRLEVTNGGTLDTSVVNVGNNDGSGTGTVQLTDGTILADVNLFGGATLSGDGTIEGTVTVHDASAEITPGASPGQLTINSGNLVIDNGTLVFDINGVTTPGTDFDRINVANGSADLNAGTIRLNFGPSNPFFGGGPISLITSSTGVTLMASAFALSIVANGNNDTAHGIVVEESITGNELQARTLDVLGSPSTVLDFSGNSANIIITLTDGVGSTDGVTGGDILFANITEITGGASENTIIASGSDDITLFGGAADDNLGGADGADSLEGGDGDDIIVGGGGIDVIQGGPGDDILIGGAGDDELRSGGAVLNYDGLDLLMGGEGNDTLISEGGHSILNGGPGNDIIQVNDTGDFFDWAHADYQDSTSGIVANLTDTAQTIGFVGSQVFLNPNQISDGLIDPATTSVGTDTVTGIHVLRDSEFDDFIVVDSETFTNSFTFTDGGGNIQNFLEVRLTAGNDTLEFQNVTRVARLSYKIAEGGVSVTMVGTPTNPGDLTDPWTIATTATDFGNPLGTFIGTDTITQNNQVRGSDFADQLFGSDREDRQEGFRGSGGVDHIDGGGGFDRIQHGDSSSGIIVDLSVNLTVDDGLGTYDHVFNVERADGTIFDDFIAGDASNNWFFGDLGTDVLIGDTGHDFLSGDFSNTLFLDGNTLTGGNDTLDGGVGFDTLEGGTEDDTFIYRDNYDQDVILDFTAGAGTEDTIKVINSSTSVITSFALALANTVDDVGNNNTTITFDPGVGNHTLTLEGVLSGDLHPDDFEFVNPTTNADVVELSEAHDTFDGLAGNDVIEGLAGDDEISGGDGNDFIDGGAGSDFLRGNDGNDTLLAGGAPINPSVWIFQGASDQLRGGADNDTLTAEGGFVVMRGGSGSDTINVVDSGLIWDFANVDYSDATQGIVANLTNTQQTIGFVGSQVTLDANEISDGIIDPATTALGIDTVTGVHVLRDSDFDDYIVVDSSFTNSKGSFIAVRLSEGDDFVDFTGFTAADAVARASWRNADDGVDVELFDPVGAATTYTATVVDIDPVGNGDQIGTDTITFDVNTHSNQVRGTNFDDTFQGNSLDNVFRGSRGDDTIMGGGGTDRADYTDAADGVEIDLTLTNSGAGEREVIDDGHGDSDDLDSIEDIRGGHFDDMITGDGGNNKIDGRQGNDILNGGGGDDTLIGDTGNVPGLFGGNDILNGEAGNDILKGGDGSDILRGGSGNDTLEGENGDDILEISNDTFLMVDGGDGEDTLFLDGAFDLDFSTAAINNVKDIEAVDLENGQANKLTLDLNAVELFSDSVHETLDLALPFVLPEAVSPGETLLVDGDSVDQVDLKNSPGGGEWQLMGDAPAFEEYDVYAYVDAGGSVQAAVAIDDDVPVTVVA